MASSSSSSGSGGGGASFFLRCFFSLGASSFFLRDPALIRAGFVLQQGDVEVNCALETLAELSRADLAGQVAAVLFD